ncbi:MAG: hypothetical protein ABFS14_02405 [Gemmatimonadota bacterium]
MRRLHVVVGALLFGAFLATGIYMDLSLGHLRDMDQATRMFYRSRHIYILMAALLHAGIGAYYRMIPGRERIQKLGSLLTVAAGGGLVAAFFTEAVAADLRSSLSLYSIAALTLGTTLHLAAGLRRQR